jgi:hypothetical protein
MSIAKVLGANEHRSYLEGKRIFVSGVSVIWRSRGAET